MRSRRTTHPPPDVPSREGHVPRATGPEPGRVWEATLRMVEELLRTFAAELKHAGLPLPWYDVLIQLHDAPDGRLRMQDLADRVVLSRSGLTRLIDRMEHEGLVGREPVEDDRRGYFAVLTPEGSATYDRHAPGHHRSIYEHFTRHLDEADLIALDRAARKVREANRAADGEG